MSKPELDLDTMNTTTTAGPMPEAVRARMKTRRNLRRRRAVGMAMAATGLAVAVVLWVPRTPVGVSSPTPAAPELALGPVELRFDDPMFLAMDRAEGARGFRREAGQTRWRIGSYLRGDWPSDL